MGRRGCGHATWSVGLLCAVPGQYEVFERWVEKCPLAYRSGNAPHKRDVLGTLMMGMLASRRRYAHITALRGDEVAAQVLGINKIVSEDALRQALDRLDTPGADALGH